MCGMFKVSHAKILMHDAEILLALVACQYFQLGTVSINLYYTQLVAIDVTFI